MTLIQLKTILMVAKVGSVSLAAKQLGISQSNASSYIKSVEDELGFKILERNRGGVKATERGQDFLRHSQKIIDESEEIYNISRLPKTYTLRVGSMNYSKALDIIIDNYTNNKDNDNRFDVQYHNVSFETGVEMLKDNQIDILVAFLRESSLATSDWICSTYNLTRFALTKYQFGVRLRKDHPLFQNEDFIKGNFETHMLKDYPYIDYPSFNKESKILSIDDNSYQSFSYRIMIDGKENRLKFCGQSDGFSIGTMLSKEDEEKYNLISYPIKGLDGYLNIFIRKGEENIKEINQYIETFKKQI